MGETLNHGSRPWLVLLELTAFGFFNSLLLMISIMALHSLDAIFTSASQLLLLLPIAACILLVLVAVAFSDAQCRSYMVRLDGRLSYILDLLQLRSAYPSRFLQNVFLPLILTLPATPFTGLFLAITTPWLFGILLINLAVSGMVIKHYNRTLTKIEMARTSYGLSSQTAESSSNSRSNPDGIKAIEADPLQSVQLPSYLLRNQTLGIPGSALLNEDEMPSFLLATPTEDRLTRRKREALGIVRSVSQGLILATSAVLALLQLSSLGSIVGFFIISASFRKAFLALFEFLFPRGEPITLAQAYGFISIALLSPKALHAKLEERHDHDSQDLQRFNQRYSTFIGSKQFIRLRNISLVHAQNGLALDRLTSRLELSACTIIRVPSTKLAQEVRMLIRHLEVRRQDNWYFTGDVLCGGQKLTHYFLNLMPLRAPWKVRLVSTSLESSFSPDQQEAAKHLINKYHLDQIIYGEDGFRVDLASLTKRQSQRFRSLISLMIMLLEPACISVGAFLLESFDSDEIPALLSMVQTEAERMKIFIVLLTRSSCAVQEGLPRYELTRTALNRVRHE